MSSNMLLVKASQVTKIYYLANKPFDILKNALFGISLPKTDQLIVLDSIDIEVRRGETLGIMGKNGAGKTTLLSILGDISQPTFGKVERFCKIATLLGLTAGFNPNFTGRENAYLFCNLQRVNPQEIEKKLQLIEKFADIGRYFDLPLSTYSSGMQARLAFSCAAHVDADLIIIDETLAVGDANFRIKCYEKIDQMKANGQTFILVSHNPNLVANFCSRGVVINNGKKVFDGPTFEAIECYKEIRMLELSQKKNISEDQDNLLLEHSDGDFTIKSILLKSLENGWNLSGEISSKVMYQNVAIFISIRNASGIVIATFESSKSNQLIDFTQDTKHFSFVFKNNLLPGKYYLSVSLNQNIGDLTKPLEVFQNIADFEAKGNYNSVGIVNLEPSLIVD